MPSILLFSHDIQLAKDLQAASRLCTEAIMVYPCSNGRKFAEYGHQYRFAAVLIDEAFHDPQAADWVKKLRAGLSVELGNQKAPVILLGAERDADGIEKLLWQGYADLVAKPVDLSLLLQKLQLALAPVQLLKEDLLFSLDVKSQLQVSLTTELVRASEFGALMRSSRAFQVGEVLKLHSPMFGEADPSVWAKVVRCESSPPSGGFQAELAFLGLSRATLTAIRLWLKKQYIDAHEIAAASEPTAGAHGSSSTAMRVEVGTPGQVNSSSRASQKGIR